jgi:hypothetical protein
MKNVYVPRLMMGHNGKSKTKVPTLIPTYITDVKYLDIVLEHTNF